MRSFLAMLLPRPRDVIEKGVVFWYGFIAALAVLGIQDQQLSIINTLFKYQVNEFVDKSTVPSWIIWGLGLLIFEKRKSIN